MRQSAVRREAMFPWASSLAQRMPGAASALIARGPATSWE